MKRTKPDSEFPTTKTVAIDPVDSNQLQIVIDNFDLDWDEIILKTVEKPLEKILDAFDINLMDVKTGNKQASLFSF